MAPIAIHNLLWILLEKWKPITNSILKHLLKVWDSVKYSGWEADAHTHFSLTTFFTTLSLAQAWRGLVGSYNGWLQDSTASKISWPQRGFWPTMLCVPPIRSLPWNCSFISKYATSFKFTLDTQIHCLLLLLISASVTLTLWWKAFCPWSINPSCPGICPTARLTPLNGRLTWGSHWTPINGPKYGILSHLGQSILGGKLQDYAAIVHGTVKTD